MKIDLSPQIYYLDYNNSCPEKPIFDRGKLLNYQLRNGKLSKKEGSCYFGPIKKVKKSQLPQDTEMVVIIVNATTAYECQTQIFSWQQFV